MKIFFIISLWPLLTFSKQSKTFYFEAEVHNMLNKEMKRYRINAEDFFVFPEKIAGWSCRLEKATVSDGFKSLICEKGNSLISTSVGCGLNDDRVAKLQVQDFTLKHEQALTIEILCPAKQF